mmetsp:Transcript_9097/g.13988  ORF Transcript_9097/g.13988 Transcript_9097/m.13988 type:complete len:110 (+) Transcript_9097:164-493(+)
MQHSSILLQTIVMFYDATQDFAASQTSQVSGQANCISLLVQSCWCSVGRRKSQRQSRIFPSIVNLSLESTQASLQTPHVSGQTMLAWESLSSLHREAILSGRAVSQTHF